MSTWDNYFSFIPDTILLYISLWEVTVYQLSCIFVCPVSHASKVMLKILQARLQQYVNHELPDVQGGFRKGRETRDQIANICWIMEKAR